MPKIEKDVFIAAPVAKVFAFMAEPSNLLVVWPGLIEIKNVQPLPSGGYCFDWVYKMAGLPFKGQADWIEFKLNQRLVSRNQSGIPSTFTWNYQLEDGGTHLSLNVEYSIPDSLLHKLAEPVVRKINEHEVDAILANLKVCLEG